MTIDSYLVTQHRPMMLPDSPKFPQNTWFSNEQPSRQQAVQKCPSNVHFSHFLCLFANCEQELQIASFSSERGQNSFVFPAFNATEQPYSREWRKLKSDPHESYFPALVFYRSEFHGVIITIIIFSSGCCVSGSRAQ